MIQVFTDGGFSIPKNKGGWAFIVVKNDEIVFEDFGTETNSTSNRMELTAFLRALEYIKHVENNKVELYADSKYTVEGYNNWLKNWRENNYKKLDYKDIKNKDLWVKIDKLQFSYLDVKWVKSHSKSKDKLSIYNNIVDKLTRIY